MTPKYITQNPYVPETGDPYMTITEDELQQMMQQAYENASELHLMSPSKEDILLFIKEIHRLQQENKELQNTVTKINKLFPPEYQYKLADLYKVLKAGKEALGETTK